MYSQFILAGGVTNSLHFKHQQLVWITSPLRSGEYSGAAINIIDGVAYVVSMTASSDLCTSIATNWQSVVSKVVLV
jgi:hypothetical protein